MSAETTLDLEKKRFEFWLEKAVGQELNVGPALAHLAWHQEDASRVCPGTPEHADLLERRRILVLRNATRRVRQTVTEEARGNVDERVISGIREKIADFKKNVVLLWLGKAAEEKVDCSEESRSLSEMHDCTRLSVREQEVVYRKEFYRLGWIVSCIVQKIFINCVNEEKKIHLNTLVESATVAKTIEEICQDAYQMMELEPDHRKMTAKCERAFELFKETLEVLERDPAEYHLLAGRQRASYELQRMVRHLLGILIPTEVDLKQLIKDFFEKYSGAIAESGEPSGIVESATSEFRMLEEKIRKQRVTESASHSVDGVQPEQEQSLLQSPLDERAKEQP